MKTRFFFLSTFWLTLFFCIGAFAQDPSPPTAPQNFQATPGEGYVNLAWDPPTDLGNPAATYEIRRATDGNPFTPLGIAPVPSRTGGFTASDTTVTNGTTYYYVIRAENSEGYADSGVRSATPQVANLSDLTVSAYAFPSTTLAPGGFFNIYATVQNIGNGASPATQLEVYNPNAVSPRLLNVNGLASTGRQLLTIPLYAPGTIGPHVYRVRVRPTPGERRTDNNEIRVNITVTNPADLVVDTPTVDKSTLAPGESFTLTATVRNQGFGNSGAATLTYYRSTDSTITTTDTTVGTADTIDILSGSNTLNQGYPNTSEQTVALTAPSTPGTYYYGACVTTTSGSDSNTQNNCSAAVTITVSAPPDLVANLFEISGGFTLAPGERFTLDATVRNEGVGTSATTTLRLYESTDSRFRTDSQVDRVSVSALASNISSSESFRLVAPSEAGTYYYRVHVDVVANETVTHNNWSDYIVVFVEAPLVMESLRPSKFTLSAGERFTLTATVKNDGNTTSTRTAVEFYRSDDNRITSRDTSLGTETVSAIAAGRTSQVSRALTAPNTAGDYYYGACVGDDISSDACAVIKITVVAVLLSESQRPPMYWVDADVGTLQSLTRSRVESLLPNVENVTSMVVDMAGNKVYWTEKTGNRSGRIRRANLNGTNVQLVRNLTSAPRKLAIDTVNKKLYLTNSWGKVQRMNLNGSSFQPSLIVNLTSPSGVAVDAAGGKVYWIEQTGNRSGRLQRANLDGTDVELVKQLTSDPHGLTVDTVNRKLYLTNGWGKLQRMNLNGSRFEPNLIVNLDAPRGVAVDTVAKKVYWTEKNRIRRANLDGSNRQDVATGLGSPVGIVLGIAPVQARVAAAPAAAAAIPNTTALHPNYPNPFNPETWIPYQLATAADVTVTIYDLRGVRIRQLALGHQPAGVYQSRSRAAYWDGRNSLGEPVASGLYFYTLTAGDFNATRKLLIRK